MTDSRATSQALGPPPPAACDRSGRTLSGLIFSRFVMPLSWEHSFGKCWVGWAGGQARAGGAVWVDRWVVPGRGSHRIRAHPALATASQPPPTRPQGPRPCGPLWSLELVLPTRPASHTGYLSPTHPPGHPHRARPYPEQPLRLASGPLPWSCAPRCSPLLLRPSPGWEAWGPLTPGTQSVCTSHPRQRCLGLHGAGRGPGAQQQPAGRTRATPAFPMRRWGRVLG